MLSLKTGCSCTCLHTNCRTWAVSVYSSAGPSPQFSTRGPLQREIVVDSYRSHRPTTRFTWSSHSSVLTSSEEARTTRMCMLQETLCGVEGAQRFEETYKFRLQGRKMQRDQQKQATSWVISKQQKHKRPQICPTMSLAERGHYEDQDTGGWIILRSVLERWVEWCGLDWSDSG
jgi:hypothetical protein